MHFSFEVFKVIFETMIPVFKAEMRFLLPTFTFKKNKFQDKGKSGKEKNCHTRTVK